MAESRFLVVRDEEPYAIWSAERALAAGRYDDGFPGTREDHLAHAGAVRTDLRPAGVRRADR